MTVAVENRAGNGVDAKRPAWERLKRLTQVDLSWDEPLSAHTTFRIGGPVKCLARPKTEDALKALLRWAAEASVPYWVLGGGSNVLAPDGPWESLAIRLDGMFGAVECAEAAGGAVRLKVGAGVKLARLLGYCLRYRLSGMEFLVGIPGTLGGAVVMNAGTAEGSLSQVLEGISVLCADGSSRWMPIGELSPGYRFLNLPSSVIVLGATLSLRRAPREEIRRRMSQGMRVRRRTQPLNLPSAGCVFKNPPGRPAGALIESAGLKGCRIGGAEVSTRHANWIVNRGGATAGDVRQVMERVEERVFKRFGVRLEREIRVLEP
jgi:UDP-N-acetylmuramate dehydrogenase